MKIRSIFNLMLNEFLCTPQYAIRCQHVVWLLCLKAGKIASVSLFVIIMFYFNCFTLLTNFSHYIFLYSAILDVLLINTFFKYSNIFYRYFITISTQNSAHTLHDFTNSIFYIQVSLYLYKFKQRAFHWHLLNHQFDVSDPYL